MYTRRMFHALKVAEKRVRRSDYRKALKMAFSARKIDLLHTFSVDGEALSFFPLAIFSWFGVVIECDILKKFRLKRVRRLLSPYKTVQVRESPFLIRFFFFKNRDIAMYD